MRGQVVLTVPGRGPTKGHKPPKRVVISTATLTIGPGQHLAPKLPLTRQAAKWLRTSKRLRVSLTVTVTAGAGAPIKTTGTFTVKTPARRHH